MPRPTRWLVLTARASSDAQKDALTEGLLALGGTAVQEQHGTLTSYLAPPDDVDAFLARARSVLDAEIEWKWQEDEDWSETWKRGLQPRRVGRHFLVAPTWTQPEKRAGDRVISIDPEMAFGTGEHATTRGALRFLEKCVQPGHVVLDVGTGSAILAIGAALCGAGSVLGVEYDEDAIINASDNIVRNAVEQVVKLDTALVDDAYLRARGDGSFDVIAANVLSSVLKPLLASFHRSLKADGHLILGGILETEADEMIEAAEAAGFRLVAEDLEEEWWGGLLRPGSGSD
jgi:ribosomal protein L11 methyltransferase